MRAFTGSSGHPEDRWISTIPAARRLKQTSATMTNKDAGFTNWIEREPPPSLAALIKKHGSYSAIPKHAWRDYEASYAHWEERRKTRVR